MVATNASVTDTKPSLIGECVVYLGVLNYFFTVDELTPIVSRIGAEIGTLQLRITPYVTQLEDEFVPYQRINVDNPEEQVQDFMDRPLQYRVELRQLNHLVTPRFSYISLRYTFFREASTHTPRFRVDHSGDSGPLGVEFRHVVDVSDALVKYVASSNLAIEQLSN
ncbi:hypothetical protein PHMEG_0004085 [Phytophthora megakarya]|uniref:Uncharacterized protein n=1 Tax=Phytophthora megakarya TaxID=4795 RepID=A0A225WWZ2_9STRA|nr:hypothetical protein PHMEG_0004085 [Phytophthora megakarya]